MSSAFAIDEIAQVHHEETALRLRPYLVQRLASQQGEVLRCRLYEVIPPMVLAQLAAIGITR